MRCVGEHEILCCGARVRIREGDVKVLTDPKVVYCPLHEALYGTKSIDKEAVKLSVKKKIEGFGFCCENRQFDSSQIVPYGSSEIIQTCMKKKLLDCAVTVCEGAGTVISSNPSLVQGIGARLTGIIKTSPVKNIIKHIKTNRGLILDEETAKIDQVEGVRKAVKLGFRKIAVTVASFQSKSITRIRELEEKNKKAKVAVFSVCNTCADKKDMKHILKADIVCASASRLVRQLAGPKALMQLGVSIPIFALTKLGKDLLLAHLSEFNDKLVVFRSRKLPYLAEQKAPKLC